MIKENSTPITFRPSKWKTLGLFLISLLFTLAGILMINDGQMMGWFVSVFFGIGCLVFIAILLPNSSYLRLSEKGFEMRSLFKSSFTNWNEVDQFEPRYIGVNKMVFFKFNSNYEKSGGFKGMVEEMAKNEGALPDTYGHSAEELAELLNEWKNKYSN